MIRVGVIRGGISPEYEVSLSTGGAVLSHLRSDKLNEKYKAIDILIDTDGMWHIGGVPATWEKVANSVDVIFNALHGFYGEDGKASSQLSEWNIPYTGSGAFASALAYNKALAKEQFAKLGINTPKHILYPAYLEDFDGPRDEYALAKAHEVLKRMPPPWIVKPLTGGSSMGIHVCKTFEDLVRAFREGVGANVSILVEELIEGREATVGVINHFRGDKVYALPPVEIQIPKDKKFFDYDTKYGDNSHMVCPGRFHNDIKSELEEKAKLIHEGLNLDHYSRTDFIIHPKKGIYALEVNTLPGLTNTSLLPHALSSIGSNMSEFIDHVITLALKK